MITSQQEKGKEGLNYESTIHLSTRVQQYIQQENRLMSQIKGSIAKLYCTCRASIFIRFCSSHKCKTKPKLDYHILLFEVHCNLQLIEFIILHEDPMPE
jgi:hypothetical protein